ncbi:MAG: hypothetical protein J5I81_09570 [Nitrococcus mobilis]|nr:hypothetical protein [Nitrococcus mobilis]
MSLRRIAAYTAGWVLIQKRGDYLQIKLGPAYEDCPFWASRGIGAATSAQRRALWRLLAHRMPAHGVRS